MTDYKIRIWLREIVALSPIETWRRNQRWAPQSDRKILWESLRRKHSAPPILKARSSPSRGPSHCGLYLTLGDVSPFLVVQDHLPIERIVEVFPKMSRLATVKGTCREHHNKKYSAKMRYSSVLRLLRPFGLVRVSSGLILTRAPKLGSHLLLCPCAWLC